MKRNVIVKSIRHSSAHHINLYLISERTDAKTTAFCLIVAIELTTNPTNLFFVAEHETRSEILKPVRSAKNLLFCTYRFLLFGEQVNEIEDINTRQVRARGGAILCWHSHVASFETVW